VIGVLSEAKHEVFYLYMTNDDRYVCGVSEKKDRMKDGDSGDEYRGGKRRDDENATVPTKLHVSEKQDRRCDEDGI
jgi:hypothetical protein